MAWRITITLRNSSTGAPVSGQTVQLYEGDGTGSLLGTFTDNTDGTYYLVMTSIGSVIGTVKINGTVQTEKVSIPYIGEDVITHLTQPSYGGGAVPDSIHGLENGDGSVVGTAKTQSLTNKTITDASNHVSASVIDSGTLASARLPTGIPDSNLAQITTGNKVAGSALQLASTPAIENSAGIRVKLPSVNPTLERTSDGLEVLIGSSDPGLKKTATGLAVDESTLPQIVTAGKVHPSAIVSTWQDPKNFPSTYRLDQAIAALDTALQNLRTSVLRPDTNFSQIWAQAAEATRNSAGASTTSGTNSAQYILGDTTALPGLLKVSVPFIKSRNLNRLIIRGDISNTTAGQTATITVRIINAAGTTQFTFVKTQTGSTWLPINGVANISGLGSGMYWAEIWLRSGANTAQLRGGALALANDAWVTAENDPAYWGGYEDDFS